MVQMKKNEVHYPILNSPSANYQWWYVIDRLEEEEILRQLEQDQMEEWKQIELQARMMDKVGWPYE